MNRTSKPYHEVKLYIGSVRGYNGRSFTESELMRCVQDFQTVWNKERGWTVAVRLTKTLFCCMDYSEAGHEIAAIQYPRFPKKPEEITDFMRELQRHLLVEFRQNRMSLVINGQEEEIVELLERPDAEQTHRK